MSRSSPEDTVGLLLTVREAAVLLGQPERRVYRWLAEGRLPGGRRLGRAVYIARPELERWLSLSGTELAAERK